jgi:hypothetical protein
MCIWCGEKMFDYKKKNNFSLKINPIDININISYNKFFYSKQPKFSLFNKEDNNHYLRLTFEFDFKDVFSNHFFILKPKENTYFKLSYLDGLYLLYLINKTNSFLPIFNSEIFFLDHINLGYFQSVPVHFSLQKIIDPKILEILKNPIEIKSSNSYELSFDENKNISINFLIPKIDSLAQAKKALIDLSSLHKKIFKHLSDSELLANLLNTSAAEHINFFEKSSGNFSSKLDKLKLSHLILREQILDYLSTYNEISKINQK